MNLYAHDLSLMDFNDFSFSDPFTDSFSRRRTPLYSLSPKLPLIITTTMLLMPGAIMAIKAASGAVVALPSTATTALHLSLWAWTGALLLANGMGATLFGHITHLQDGVTVSLFLLGFSCPNQAFRSCGVDFHFNIHREQFYRVQVGVQSLEGITTTRGILRRFSDFLKLFSELKKAFPMKDLPPAPPKGFLRMKSRAQLEERRCSLEDWMEKLLSDIDLSRNVLVATFLELEAAARSSFQEVNQQIQILCNDTPYDESEIGTPRHGDDNHANPGMEHSTSEQDLIDSLATSVKFGIFNRTFVQASLERLSRHQFPGRSYASSTDRDRVSENNSDARPLRMDGTEFFSEIEDCKRDGHARRLSTESFGSDLSSVRVSETSNLGVANLFGDSSLDLAESSEAPNTFVNSDLRFSRDSLVALPCDERHKLNRVLTTMQQRLATAKTDIEDLIARLNQEGAVRQFLTTKV
ncbi:PX domain-containing protein EREX isoform X4 [Prunus yedoensis var. nudiflora]|uniref:PX domain-containing protein EREX isoform X4 n=1 Tax=Prunus yedoensis var. nudiflora TaxID=2094558 RepID=A0A314ZIT7_PRUYE|nr:PX domain-containing protein EREX isoform X4 [Prunus yedoensis var. nudiflora]